MAGLLAGFAVGAGEGVGSAIKKKGEQMREDRLKLADRAFASSEADKQRTFIGKQNDAKNLITENENKRRAANDATVLKNQGERDLRTDEFRATTLANQQANLTADKAFRELTELGRQKSATATAEWRKEEQAVRKEQQAATDEYRTLVLTGQQSDRESTAQYRDKVQKAQAKADKATAAYRTLVETGKIADRKVTADYRKSVLEQNGIKIDNDEAKTRIDRIVDANTSSTMDKYGNKTNVTEWLAVVKSLGPEETEKYLGFGKQGASEKHPFFSDDPNFNDENIPVGSVIYDVEAKDFLVKPDPSAVSATGSASAENPTPAPTVEPSNDTASPVPTDAVNSAMAKQEAQKLESQIASAYEKLAAGKPVTMFSGLMGGNKKAIEEAITRLLKADPSKAGWIDSIYGPGIAKELQKSSGTTIASR